MRETAPRWASKSRSRRTVSVEILKASASSVTVAWACSSTNAVSSARRRLGSVPSKGELRDQRSDGGVLSTATMAAVRRGLVGSSRYSHGMTSGVSPLLPPDQYIASLARKRMAAGALFRDEDGRVLLVDPTYKPTWDLPGGAVEKEESPHAACRREVTEELGLDRLPGRVLVVDWVPSRPERPEGLIVVYDGGVLAPDEVAAITTQDGELAGYAFVKPHFKRVSPSPARRIAVHVRSRAPPVRVITEAESMVEALLTLAVSDQGKLSTEVDSAAAPMACTTLLRDRLVSTLKILSAPAMKPALSETSS